MDQVRKTGIVGPAIFAAAAIGLAYGAFQLPSGATPECSSESMAFVMSQDVVAKALRSPSTAAFPSFGADRVSVARSGDCSFSVVAFVDAENGFGATTRSVYSLDMMHDPESGTWQASNLSIN